MGKRKKKEKTLPKHRLKTRLKVGDEVIVIAGKDKGKRGKILAIDREKSRVVVEGVRTCLL